MLAYDAQAAQADNLDRTAVHELWLTLDVPQVPRSEEPFARLRTVVQSHTQIRSVFSNPLILEPLDLDDVKQLLANRYAALQLDPAKPWQPPATDAVVQGLYALFRGDLRGLLKALEDGITADFDEQSGVLTFHGGAMTTEACERVLHNIEFATTGSSASRSLEIQLLDDADEMERLLASLV